jgi:hypothetical protein
MSTLQDMIYKLELQEFETWALEMERAFQTGQGQFNNKKCWSAWQARAAMTSECRGVTRDGCNYKAACGSICNKCGKQH